jgi:hypothetical protein
MVVVVVVVVAWEFLVEYASCSQQIVGNIRTPLRCGSGVGTPYTSLQAHYKPVDLKTLLETVW